MRRLWWTALVPPGEDYSLEVPGYTFELIFGPLVTDGIRVYVWGAETDPFNIPGWDLR